ncbi:hypothetical protein F1559_002468 [Cyanidiococcus yangmingshanensis]|uniref:Homeobox domain-containing protein n=1 Tax=Cyanidiococcus yangmingshanensis TaxID=2690220 RepID=A0A7J7IHD6_9RHOD|nr:hypothetical protein F1559_002468 [Cyanidiococcus yangmingshanensis]
MPDGPAEFPRPGDSGDNMRQQLQSDFDPPNMSFWTRFQEQRMSPLLKRDNASSGLEVIATTALALNQRRRIQEAACLPVGDERDEQCCTRADSMQHTSEIPSSPMGHDHDAKSRKRQRRNHLEPFTSTKKGARVFTPEQQELLRTVFAENPYPSRELVQQLAHAFDHPVRKLTTWFNNRRARIRRAQHEQASQRQKKATSTSEAGALGLNRVTTTRIPKDDRVISKALVLPTSGNENFVDSPLRARFIATEQRYPAPIARSSKANASHFWKPSESASCHSLADRESERADNAESPAIMAADYVPLNHAKTSSMTSPVCSECFQSGPQQTTQCIMAHQSLPSLLGQAASESTATPGKDAGFRRR